MIEYIIQYKFSNHILLNFNTFNILTKKISI